MLGNVKKTNVILDFNLDKALFLRSEDSDIAILRIMILPELVVKGESGSI